MRMKGKDSRRDEVHYEQLILELPLQPPPAHRRPPAVAEDDERDRGVFTLELY